MTVSFSYIVNHAGAVMLKMKRGSKASASSGMLGCGVFFCPPALKRLRHIFKDGLLADRAAPSEERPKTTTGVDLDLGASTSGLCAATAVRFFGS